MICDRTHTFEDHAVIHPLLDEPEVKLSADGLGRLKVSPSVRLCLFALRAYLVCMFILLGYHLLDMAGVFRVR
jgi:hypothetical protein